MPDAYIVAEIFNSDGQLLCKRKTGRQADTRDPCWDTVFLTPMLVDAVRLVLTCWDHDTLSDDLIGDAGAFTRTVNGSAEVIDDDCGALTCEKQCVRSAKAAACAGNDRNLAIQKSHAPSI